MQCIWTSTSNVLRKQSWRACTTTFRISPPSLCRKFTWTRIIESQVVARKVDAPSLAQAFVATAVRGTTVLPSPFPISEVVPDEGGSDVPKTLSEVQYTPAQLSRITAQSVRIACEGPSTQEAFLIVKSLQESVAHYGRGWHSEKRFSRRVAVDFGMAVSPRLAIHSLLHGLIRRGMTKKAGSVALQIFLHHPEVRLRDRTLRLITAALCQTDTKALRDEGFRSQLQGVKSQFEVYLRRPPPLISKQTTGEKVHLPCTRLAMQLFFVAKQYKKQRASEMFQQLIDACLLQGELLVVSFLFVIFVKHWQARLSKSDVMNDSEPSPTVEDPSNLLSSSTPNRKATFLSRTLSFISIVIFNTASPHLYAVKASHEEAVQALAVLAGMLHNGMLHHNQVTPLVSILVSFPASASVKVWTFRKGKKEIWERRDAREYFDEVLDHLIVMVTDENYGQRGKKNCMAGVQMFNSLLLYSLRRKMSPAQGMTIFERMQRLGGNATPNIVTFNIVLRASTLLRRPDMSEKVLETLRSRSGNGGHAIMYGLPAQCFRTKGQEGDHTGEATPTGTGLLACDKTSDNIHLTETFSALRPLQLTRPVREFLLQLPSTIQRIFAEDINLDCLVDPDSPLPADGVTLVAYVNFLTSAKNPNMVAKLVKLIIPEFSRPNGPALGDKAGIFRQSFDRSSAISRAVGLGPAFFTAILNALVKSGRTGLAVRVWWLAKAAEKSSWDPERKTMPWVLPCAAYTIMMQCYADIARKSLRRLYDSSRFPGRRQTTGLGTLSVTKRLMSDEKQDPFEISRDMGVHLFHSMQHSQQTYRARLMERQDGGGDLPVPSNIQLPVPDERFFNAALDLFGRLPSSYIWRDEKASPSRWKRLERRQRKHFIEHGYVRCPQDIRLVSLLLAMRDSGYEIPEAFRHMLVGVQVPPLARLPARPRHRVSPLHCRATVFNPIRIPTMKERGLPVARKFKGGRSRTSSGASFV